METIRSFVAVELPDEVKAALTGVQRQLMSGRQSYVKWASVDGIHLTLKFLGNVAADSVPKLVDALSASARTVSPFPLKLDEVGAFPNVHSPRVVWVGLAGKIDTLAVLQLEVEAALEPLGFAAEERDFSPHLTLGRVRETATREERQELGQRLAALHFESNVTFSVAGINLMRSQLTPGGAIYSRLAHINLVETLPASP